MFTKEEEIITATETKTTVFKRLEDWRGNCFESSCYKTPEFLLEHLVLLDPILD